MNRDNQNQNDNQSQKNPNYNSSVLFFDLLISEKV